MKIDFRSPSVPALRGSSPAPVRFAQSDTPTSPFTRPAMPGWRKSLAALALLPALLGGCDRPNYDNRNQWADNIRDTRAALMEREKAKFAKVPQDPQQQLAHLREVSKNIGKDPEVSRVLYEHRIKEWAFETSLGLNLPAPQKILMLIDGLSGSGSMYESAKSKANVYIAELRKDKTVDPDLREDFETLVRLAPDITYDAFKGKHYQGHRSADYTALEKKLRDQLEAQK
jgi:hypothetical protein